MFNGDKSPDVFSAFQQKILQHITNTKKNDHTIFIYQHYNKIVKHKSLYIKSILH